MFEALKHVLHNIILWLWVEKGDNGKINSFVLCKCCFVSIDNVTIFLKWLKNCRLVAFNGAVWM